MVVLRFERKKLLFFSCLGRGKGFVLSMLSRPALGSTCLLSSSYLGLFFPGEKRQKRETDNSILTIVEVKNTWIYTSTSIYLYVRLYLTLQYGLCLFPLFDSSEQMIQSPLTKSAQHFVGLQQWTETSVTIVQPDV
jgi:hypothetical protein